MKQKSMTTYQLALTGVMTAVICILGPMTLMIPISPVPISLANLAICLSIVILGMKLGTLSCILYLLIGLAGLPVFSGFSGGIGKLAGPTGGYLVGYLFLALIGGVFAERFSGKGLERRAVQGLGLVLGTAVLYAFGTVWLAYMAGMNFAEALAVGVLPFIPGDLVKIFLTLLLGPEIRTRLLQAGYLNGVPAAKAEPDLGGYTR